MIKSLVFCAVLMSSFAAFAGPMAPDSYLRHKALFKDDIVRVGDTPVWSLTDHGVNIAIVEAPEGLILIDSGTDRGYAEKALGKIKTISSKPIKALVYTHHHLDHVNGAGYFIDPSAASQSDVIVIGAANLVDEMTDENIMLSPIMGLRSSYMYGFGLEGQEAELNYVGCCGDLPGETTQHETLFIPPSVEVESSLTMTLAGVEFQFFRTGGEAVSHLVAWLPKYKLLLSGDEIQGPTFPNLHSMRGTKMRDAELWVGGIDKMRALQPEHLVPGHGHPVSGKAEIDRILTHYRDAIQYAYDQSIRYINKGYNAEELGRKLNSLPDYLHIDPWTGEHYGNLSTAARSYYVGHISWFSGDAVDLAPTPRPEFNRRLVELMGGEKRVLSAARKAMQRNDYQFAAELAGFLIVPNRDSKEARQIKADAFRKLGYAETNTNWRNFYLVGAMELEGRLDHRKQAAHLNNPDNLARVPAHLLVQQLRYRVDAEKAGDRNLAVRLILTDVEESFLVELRNSIVEINPVVSREESARIRLTRSALAAFISGQSGLNDLIQRKEATVEHGDAEARRFFELFDVGGLPKPLVVR